MEFIASPIWAAAIGSSAVARRGGAQQLDTSPTTRFLILPCGRSAAPGVAHPGPHGPADFPPWERIYGHPIFLLETFIDPEPLRGTSIGRRTGDGLGRTTGRGRTTSVLTCIGRSRKCSHFLDRRPRVTPEHIARTGARAARRHLGVRSSIRGSKSTSPPCSYQKLPPPSGLSAMRPIFLKGGRRRWITRSRLCATHTEEAIPVLLDVGVETDGIFATPSVSTPLRPPGQFSATAHLGTGARAARASARLIKVWRPVSRQAPPRQRPSSSLTLVVVVRIKGPPPSPGWCTSWRSCSATCAEIFYGWRSGRRGAKKYDETAASIFAVLTLRQWDLRESTFRLQENFGNFSTSGYFARRSSWKPPRKVIQSAGDDAGFVRRPRTMWCTTMILPCASWTLANAASDADIAAERNGNLYQRHLIHWRRHGIGLYFTVWRKHTGENLADVLVLPSARGRKDPKVARAVAQSAQVTRETGTHRLDHHLHARPPLSEVTSICPQECRLVLRERESGRSLRVRRSGAAPLYVFRTAPPLPLRNTAGQ